MICGCWGQGGDLQGEVQSTMPHQGWQELKLEGGGPDDKGGGSGFLLEPMGMQRLVL